MQTFTTSRLSFYQAILILLLGASLISISLIAVNASLFQHYAQENEQSNLQDIIAIATKNRINDLTRKTREMGSLLQSEKALREAILNKNTETITRLLDDQYHQYFTTAGVLQLQKLYIFDHNLKLLARSKEGVNDKQTGILCPVLQSTAAKRTGAERVKYLQDICTLEGTTYHAMLVPIGGLRPIGYIQIVSDPAYSLRPVESDLGMPLEIRYPNDQIAFRSNFWPNEATRDQHFIASYSAKTHSDSPALFHVYAARDNSAYQKQVEQIRTLTITSSAGLFLVTLILGIALFNRAFQPLNKLRQAALRIKKGDYQLLETDTFKDISEIIHAFNVMSESLNVSISDLTLENKTRQDIENQLIRNQRSLEEARDRAIQASNIKSDFLANMSHEIRTPLTAIIGFAETTLDSDQTMEERLDAINTIIHNGQHLLQIINDILDLSKIEANKIELDKTQFSLVQVIEDARPLAEYQCQAKGLYFNIKYHYPVPDMIFTDPLRIKQVLFNLISNAAKFTENGKIEIDVRFIKDTEQVILDVTDTGIGLTDDQQHNIFEQFTQADNSTSKKYGGTGLGLSISKKLAKMMGGDLRVESKIDQGSTFRFSFQCGAISPEYMLRDETELPISKHTKPAKGITLHKQYKGSILLAEDTEENRKLLQIYLRKLGPQVICDVVENGSLAIEAVQKKNYDLILMDIQMPVMGGMQACHEIQQSARPQKIIALTANVLAHDVRTYLDSGFSGHLGKPINRSEFYQTVTTYLQEVEIDNQSPIVSRLVEEDPEMLDIVERFLEKLPDMLSNLKKFFNSTDKEDFLHELHSLKGVGGGMGYPEITDLASKIEFQCRNQNLESVGFLLRELETLINRLKIK